MARTVTRPTLTDVLVQQGILTKQTLDQVLNRLGGVTAAFGQTLVSEGILSEEQLAHALAAQFDLPCNLLTEFRVDQAFYDSMSVKLMQRHPFIPIAEHAGRLTIAIPDPQNLLALDELELLLGSPLDLVVGTRSAILAALERSEGSGRASSGARGGVSICVGEGGRTRRGSPHDRSSRRRSEPCCKTIGFDSPERDAASRQRHSH